MPSTPPSASNGYRFAFDTRLDVATLNTIFTSLHERLQAQEAQVADYQAAIDQLTEAGLSMIAENVGPQLEAARQQLVDLEVFANQLSDDVGSIRDQALQQIADLATQIDNTLADAEQAIQAAIGLLGERDQPNGFAGVGEDGKIPASLLPVLKDFARFARTSNVVIGAQNIGQFIDITAGTFTQTFASVEDLPDGWFVYLRNSGTGDTTLDPNGTEQIDGLTSYIMYPGEMRLIYKDGAALRSVVMAAFVKKFTTSENFIKPPGYAFFGVEAWGAGGGGGAGITWDVSGNKNGGGAGGGGAYTFKTFTAGSILDSTAVTIGAGGSGAPPSSTVAAVGANGTAGGATQFAGYLSATGGSPGAGGGVNSGGGGGIGGTVLSTYGLGVVGGAGGNGQNGSPGGGGGISLLAGPGGGGGGSRSDGVINVGGNGGYQPGSIAPTGGTTAGSAGANGGAFQGGGGGAASHTGNGGKGGDGGVGGGGGGGGGTYSGWSGGGGNGGRGELRIRGII